MESTIFKFRTDKSWVKVFNALNDTCYVFTAPDRRLIRVWGETAIKSVRKACDEANIKYVEIKTGG
jgi:hypothetical protein